MDAIQIAGLIVLFAIAVLIGGGLFYVHFLLSKAAAHKAMDERGLGRRLK